MRRKRQYWSMRDCASAGGWAGACGIVRESSASYYLRTHNICEQEESVLERVRIFSGAGLDVQWSGGSYLGVQWSGHVRRGFGGADDVAKRLIANWQKRAKQDDDVINHQLHGVAS